MYSGKTIDLVPKVTDVVRDLAGQGGLSHVILLPSAKTGTEVGKNVKAQVPMRCVRAWVVLSLLD